MYKKIESSPRMTESEAYMLYPDDYILMQKESRDTYDPIGIVLYVGDNYDELFSLQVDLPVPMGIVTEGENIQKRICLGGLVVGE